MGLTSRQTRGFFIANNMEIYQPDRLILRKELKGLIGGFIESWPEFNHITIFYSVNNARVGNQTCTDCHLNPPIIIRHERDHMAQEFWDALCEKCTPARILNKLRGECE
jgi:hypothetical protein